MKRTGTYRLMAVAVLLAAVMFFACPKTALAQDNVYSLSYFSNAHNSAAPDATLRVVNDGNQIANPGNTSGDICANIYVFDAAEELLECCSCRLTPNHLLTLAVNKDLTNNPLTGVTLGRGVIKVISSLAPVPPSVCDPTTPNVFTGLRGWLTHIQKNQVGTSTTYSVTEEELTDSSLSAPEFADLGEDCAVALELGSGKGICATRVVQTFPPVTGETAADFCVDAGR